MILHVTTWMKKKRNWTMMTTAGRSFTLMCSDFLLTKHSSAPFLVRKNTCSPYRLRVPTDTGKPGKMRQLFPVREKSGNFEKILKSQGILSESGKSQGKLGFIN